MQILEEECQDEKCIDLVLEKTKKHDEFTFKKILKM